MYLFLIKIFILLKCHILLVLKLFVVFCVKKRELLYLSFVSLSYETYEIDRFDSNSDG